jgi:hypothetical protein
MYLSPQRSVADLLESYKMRTSQRKTRPKRNEVEFQAYLLRHRSAEAAPNHLGHLRERSWTALPMKLRLEEAVVGPQVVVLLMSQIVGLLSLLEQDPVAANVSLPLIPQRIRFQEEDPHQKLARLKEVVLEVALQCLGNAPTVKPLPRGLNRMLNKQTVLQGLHVQQGAQIALDQDCQDQVVRVKRREIQVMKAAFTH